ncbi:hypothetical protein [Chromobacterium sp. IIBBL 290-4]|uniref:hypothetical protein n=1 Tax=Chromobacterium sp. IIBBL 290-4 TaxID=2953890 RepID=UPI0020B7417D|nr:hypothetical protein [Chromobacterium sp. IIBBL 290-4]UTH74376.1 hypothetical protein NKT35_23020 [Chromobacterium sp. IIBBL 290-4]
MTEKFISAIQRIRFSFMQLRWRKALIGLATAMLFLMLLSPELAFFSFLLDAVVIDAILIFAGFQLAHYWAYVKYVFGQISQTLRATIKEKQ